MILEFIDIAGFRGISQLRLPLEEDNLLIGENAWGKSSLLDVLTLILSPRAEPYTFSAQDFYQPATGPAGQPQRLWLALTWRESEAGEAATPRWQGLSSLWQRGEGGLQRVHLRIDGQLQADGEVTTRRRFVDAHGEPLLTEGEATAALESLVRLSPVLRLRDARFNARLPREALAGSDEARFNELVRQMESLTRDHPALSEQLSEQTLRQGLRTLQQLLAHYFSLDQHSVAEPARRLTPGERDNDNGWRHLDRIHHLIADADSRSRRQILLRLFGLLTQARGAWQLDANARPLLLIEDPETRLHPIMLSVAWGLFSQLPLQKITTTNSSELLSQVPMGQVCRLVREAERVVAWRLGPGGMSAEESRRIAFHIRFNRPSALFARCWLLVEGETEVWLMNELARQCGYHFATEGIRIIEFAQSGLRPLLKFAQRMGIGWHVLTDGDDAGKKYAATARSLLHPGDEEKNHLTQLPTLDMEHFLYKQGFSAVYHRHAHLPDNVPIAMRRVIAKAIHHSSKPELAMAVVQDAAERGPDAVPLLLQTLFARLQRLARRGVE
ncbi:DUF2813 domain-containing protein [Erwinia sp. E602]|uniref:ATP-dependent nuclease n=1 Tax=Erwinia sp. E602 TaxID=2675378 RepID=UPI001BA6D325|nr:ATP-dependent endonuclease [Erwinia sp. E602]QUG76486.1 DUF2813 domain-containing protein [Erwinia sp. E602]